MTRAAPYNRDAALESAMQLFWNKGFHATSLKDLEVALGMKPGSIYSAFSSKENLYLLALEKYFDESLAGFQASMDRAVSPLSGLADHFRSYTRLAPDDVARQACMLTKTLIDTRSTDPELLQHSRDYLLAMQCEFASAFARAIAQGELPKTANPERLARRFQANVSALRFELAKGVEAAEFAALAEDMATEIEQLKLSA